MSRLIAAVLLTPAPKPGVEAKLVAHEQPGRAMVPRGADDQTDHRVVDRVRGSFSTASLGVRIAIRL